jgi:hypothetical protein
MSDIESSIPTEHTDSRLTLNIVQKEDGFVDACVPVRWSVSDELIKSLIDRWFVSPQLVIVVRTLEFQSLGEDLKRPCQTAVFTAPLTSELQYIYFNRPGWNEVRAVIVDTPDQKDKQNLHHACKHATWFRENGELTSAPSANHLKYLELKTALKVFVPQKMFAKNPRPISTKLVKRFYHTKELEACQFRRRLILSVIWAFLLLIVGQVVKLTLTIVGVLTGIRNLQWGELLHPWQGDIDGTIPNVQTSIWFSDRQGKFRPSVLNVFNPIVMFAPAAVVFYVLSFPVGNTRGHGNHHVSNLGWWNTVFFVDASIIALVFIIVMTSRLIQAVEKRQPKSNTDKIVKKLDADEEARLARQARISAALAQMNDANRAANVSLSALPAEKQTIILRYRHIKAKYCKPIVR